MSDEQGREIPPLRSTLVALLLATLEAPKHFWKSWIEGMCWVALTRTMFSPSRIQTFPQSGGSPPSKLWVWTWCILEGLQSGCVIGLVLRVDSHLGFADSISMPSATFWCCLTAGLAIRISAMLYFCQRLTFFKLFHNGCSANSLTWKPEEAQR